MKHTLMGTPENPCNCNRDFNCPICDGGLSLCVVCKGAEASLPKECPGREMTQEEQDGITSGNYDFVGGRWIGMIPVSEALRTDDEAAP